ncbi:MAG TPA: AAC(3) family N-acetyltransferase [Polyangiales bacterium]|nr:AAC(3) family N-acetyltransferase [Polyangiales bacterium]
MQIDQVIEQLRALGVQPDGVLLVHTSFKALRPIERGPLGLIEALRAVAGTLVMPTMTDGESVFDPQSTPTVDMGITAELFWRQPGVVRSTHPGGSFAAVGPEAERICAPQPLSPPHGHESPVGRVYDLDGQVLLLGVGHSEDTTLHLAEALAGVPYSIAYPTVIAEGQTALIAETDHCCRRFALADAWLGTLQRAGPVGHGQARLSRARDIVRVALEHLRQEPLVFLCREGCDECALARASVAR